MSTQNPASNAPLPLPPSGGNGRRFWVTLLLGLVIAVCSAAIGAAGTIFWLKGKVGHGHRRVPAETTARIKADLGLSDEQTASVETIVRERYGALDKIRQETMPRVRTELEGIRNGIQGVLTPEQAAQWDKEFESIFHMSRLVQLPEAAAPAERREP
jgi:hypothetical protein